jgi:hypothetical protein
MVITSAAADIGTTEWALQRPGLREANPLLQAPAQRAAGKTLGTAAILYGTDYLEKRGHKRWSKWIRIGTVVFWSGCAVNNALRTRGAR